MSYILVAIFNTEPFSEIIFLTEQTVKSFQLGMQVLNLEQASFLAI